MTGGCKLGIGAAQFGLDYGISNLSGRVSSEEVGRILEEAARLGVEFLDTAAGYGEIEEVLGRYDLTRFRVVTKTPHLYTNNDPRLKGQELQSTFEASICKLRLTKVYGLLCHNAGHLLSEDGEHLYKIMARLKADGLVEKIGVSVYSGTQINLLLERYPLELIQLPLNVFDQRLIVDGLLTRLVDRGVEIHARSVFLQGLLLMSVNDVPAYFDPIVPLLSRWQQAVRESGHTNVEAALAFVRDTPGIETVIVGVTSLAELRSCVRAHRFARPFSAEGLACNMSEFVNPSLWRV